MVVVTRSFDFARAVLDLLVQSLDAGGHRAEGVLAGSGGRVRDGLDDFFGFGFCFLVELVPVGLVVIELSVPFPFAAAISA